MKREAIRFGSYAPSGCPCPSDFCFSLYIVRHPSTRRPRGPALCLLRAQTGVVRTLPVLVQRAYAVIMGAIILSPAEACASLLYLSQSLFPLTEARSYPTPKKRPLQTRESLTRLPPAPALRAPQGARSVLHAAVAPEVAALPRPGPYLESGCKCAVSPPNERSKLRRRAASPRSCFHWRTITRM